MANENVEVNLPVRIDTMKQSFLTGSIILLVLMFPAISEFGEAAIIIFSLWA